MPAAASIEQRRERECDHHRKREGRAAFTLTTRAAHFDTCAVRAGAVAVGVPRSG